MDINNRALRFALGTVKPALNLETVDAQPMDRFRAG